MRYGAMNFPVKPLLQELAAFADLGFDFMELAMDPPAGHHLQVMQQKTALLADLARTKMQLICHMPTFVSLADLTESIRRASLQEVLRSLETAAALRAEKVVVHPAYISGMGSHVRDLARRHAIESLETIAAKAAELEMTLCLENMFPNTRFCIEVNDFTEIFERFPALKMTLDTGHGCIGSPGGKRLVKFIDSFADRIAHLHVSDNFGKEDNHLPFGTGSIPFPKILKALKSSGYDGTATFEVFTADRHYLQLSRRKFDDMWQSI